MEIGAAEHDGFAPGSETSVEPGFALEAYLQALVAPRCAVRNSRPARQQLLLSLSSEVQMLQTVSFPSTLLPSNVFPVDVTARVALARPPVIVSPPHDLFVATLAHELRQPLSTMLAAVEVVRHAPGTDAARRAADVMQRQIGQMSRLVDDLVDAARWARGKVALRRCSVDLSTVIAEVAADIEAAAVERGQMLVLPDEQAPVWVNGDRRRLSQVVSNLLGNALKYTPPGGRIAIEVERIGRTATMRISDNGRGIEPNALPHVFELFSQIAPHEGTGLGIGLSIVREIVRLHGGRIEARSQGAGQGSEFIVSLPLARAPE